MFVIIPLFLLSLINACELHSTAIQERLLFSRHTVDLNTALPRYRTFQDTSALFAHHARQVPRPATLELCNRLRPATWGKECEIAPGIGERSGAAFSTTYDHNMLSSLRLRNRPRAQAA